MARRSKAYASRSRRRRLPTSYHDCSQTASHSIDEDDMNHSDKVSPRKGANAEPGNRADARQCSEKSAVAWKTQIFKRIVEPTTDIDEFLHEFAPSTSRPPVKCPVDRFPGEVPAQAGQEPSMYAPLVRHLCTRIRPTVNRRTTHHRSPAWKRWSRGFRKRSGPCSSTTPTR